MKSIKEAAPIGHEFFKAQLWFKCLLWAGICTTAAGCYSRPGSVSAVSIDIPAVCEKIFAKHDVDADGLLSSEELAAVPPLNSCLKKDDQDGDGKLSPAELQARFEKVFNSRSGMIAASCRVTNKGKPINGATIHFIPAKYLDLDRAMMPVASGVTSDQGVAQMEIHPDYLPEDAPKIRGLVRPGFYLVDINCERLKIPPHYNSESLLGVEVSAETTVSGPIQIALKF